MLHGCILAISFSLPGSEQACKLIFSQQTNHISRLQMWQPIKGPVQDSPFTLMDAATLDNDDLIPVTLHFPGRPLQPVCSTVMFSCMANCGAVEPPRSSWQQDHKAPMES